MTDNLISMKEAAAYLGYSESGLWRIIKRSRRRAAGVAVSGPTIRFYQPSRCACIRFKREWLDEFIEQHTVNPQEAPLYKPKSKPRVIKSPLGDLGPDFMGRG